MQRRCTCAWWRVGGYPLRFKVDPNCTAPHKDQMPLPRKETP